MGYPAPDNPRVLNSGTSAPGSTRNGLQIASVARAVFPRARKTAKTPLFHGGRQKLRRSHFKRRLRDSACFHPRLFHEHATGTRANLPVVVAGAVIAASVKPQFVILSLCLLAAVIAYNLWFFRRRPLAPSNDRNGSTGR